MSQIRVVEPFKPLEESVAISQGLDEQASDVYREQFTDRARNAIQKAPSYGAAQADNGHDQYAGHITMVHSEVYPSGWQGERKWLSKSEPYTNCATTSGLR